MMMTLIFEISVPGKTLTIEAADVVAAVPAILSVLGLTGHELMLDTNDYRDITGLVKNGAWLVRNNHAYRLKTWRGDFTQARKLYPSWLGKLKQLERLAINTKSRR